MDLIFVLLIIFIPLIAQFYVNATYRKNLQKQAQNNKTGYDIAREILDKNDLKDLLIVETGGTLTDHYDPTRKVIRLSKNIYHGSSLASQAVAAHEVGHAIQDKEGYTFLRIRSFIFPIVNIISRFSYYLIIIGLIFEFLELLYVGIAAVSIGVGFQIITLPVEFNASKKAIEELEKYGLTTSTEKDGIKEMLTAAALTYVAGVLAGILEILRLIGLARND